METKVTFIYDYKSIEIPGELLELQMPDMEGFIDFQFQTLAEKHSTIELPEGQKHVLTDEMVKKEDLPGIETVKTTGKPSGQKFPWSSFPSRPT